MLKNIPTHLIAGPLGAGKTSLIRQLLAQKPATERWAVLINEFGRIGLDAALLDSGTEGVAFAEVAGGCLCCVNGVPFQVALTRLLRKVRPCRLLIEPSGLGHPVGLWDRLMAPPWFEVLALRPAVLVLDAADLVAGAALPSTQAEMLAMAGLLVLNKAESLDGAARAQLAERLPRRPLYWTSQGALPLALLPELAVRTDEGGGLPGAELPAVAAALEEVWADPRLPICVSQARADGWSIGWRWHASQRFALTRIRHWLSGLHWRRAKLVLHTGDGWLSGNALDRQPIRWQPSEWRRDSRLELIFAEAQDEEALRAAMEACRLPG
ncbi:CobW family GTP-binding protein [Azotobacter vinelandii]